MTPPPVLPPPSAFSLSNVGLGLGLWPNPNSRRSLGSAQEHCTPQAADHSGHFRPDKRPGGPLSPTAPTPHRPPGARLLAPDRFTAAQTSTTGYYGAVELERRRPARTPLPPSASILTLSNIKAIKSRSKSATTVMVYVSRYKWSFHEGSSRPGEVQQEPY